VDDWGCVWRTTQYGFVGTIVEHPLATDAALASFAPPPADTYNGGQTAVDFGRAAAHFARVKEQGGLARGGLDHGFFMLRLEYLRGFENLMCDLIQPTDEFRQLHRTVHELNVAAVRNWLAAGADIVGLPEDLGGQDRSLIGPKYFREWALPCYVELHRMAQEQGALTYFHCDGNVMDIADQILEINPTIFNPQDLANGIENLRDTFKGRITLDLDFDRQHALPFGTPQEIRELVEYEVRTLGAPEGGLMIKVEIRGDVPPDNLDAVASALEEYSTFWH
jgi:uroporphyrinogen decarboxylase